MLVQREPFGFGNSCALRKETWFQSEMEPFKRALSLGNTRGKEGTAAFNLDRLVGSLYLLYYNFKFN